MGCDIHCYLEKKTHNGWVPLWEPRPDKIWWDALIYDYKDSGELLSFSTDEKDSLEAIRSYFRKLSIEEAIERFGNNRHFCWYWREQGRECNLSDRDYRWFAALGLETRRTEAMGTVFTLRGIPKDVSARVTIEVESWSGDGHSHSWLMVSEILSKRRLQHFLQWTWLRNNITDPENTRMVFWFDN